MIPWAIDDLIISDDVLWQSALKDAHGLPQSPAQLAERFGRWPAFGGLGRPGRRLSLVTLWNHASHALRAAAKLAFERYASPEREVIRRLTAVDSIVQGVAPSSVLLALGPWDVARSGATYAPRDLLDPDTIGTVSGGVIWRNGLFGHGLQVAQATTNLLSDPSFEYDATLSLWTKVTLTGTRSTDVSPRYGAYVAKLDNTGGGSTGRCVQTIAVTATTYTLSCVVRRLDGAPVTAADFLLRFDSANATPTFVSIGDGWYYAYYSAVATAGSRDFGLNVPTTKLVYADGIQLENLASATPYCDGSLGAGHSWSGTAHASTSARTMAYCQFANPLSMTAGTVSLWWNPSIDNTGGSGLLYFFSEGGLRAYYNVTDDKINLTDTTNTIATSALTFSAQTWIHLTFTWSASGLAIYRNGVSVATGATYTAPTAGSYFYLGSKDTTLYSCNGILDGVLALNVALTATQVAALYTATLAADWKARWCNVIAEEVKAFAIAGEETDQGVVGTLAVDGDVRWRSRDGASFWRVIAATGSVVVNNDGDDDAYPILYITPKTAKSGNSWAYKRWIPVKWRASLPATSYPVDICNDAFDTATLVTASKMQADGDDLRVKVDGVEVNRWLDGMNTATTKVFVNLDFQAQQTATMAAIGDTTSTMLTATTDITNWPSTGILYIDTEAITYTGKSNADKQFTGCTRGAKGTTAATHAAGATAYWIQHDVWVLYGNAGAAAPTVDDNYKPIFELNVSTNTSWVYNVFGEEDGLRTAQWAFSKSGSTPTRYTANHDTNVDPWDEIGIKLYTFYPDYGAWQLYNPCGMTQFSCGNNAIDRNVYDAGYWDAKIHQSSNGSAWTTAYTIAEPSPVQTWVPVASGPTQALTAGTKYLRLYLAMGSNNVGRWLYVEIENMVVTLDSSYTPVVAIGAEQSNYDLAVTLTNSTTGDSLQIALTMQLAQTLEINTDTKTITLLADNSRQMQALTLTGGARRDWLRLAAGNNTLTWSDTGTVSVEVEILFDRRYFE